MLQRTFNIVITTLTPPTNGSEEKTEEHELSMVDQADFAPIDAYIRAHALNDASMAAERRAKAYNVNKPPAGEEAAEDDGRGELEKAEEALQDAEDEEEEDYDPSGGESEGSGEDSEEDEEGEGYEDGEGGEEEWDEDEEVGAEEEGEEEA